MIVSGRSTELGGHSGDGLGRAIRDERARVLMGGPTWQGREHDANRLRPGVGQARVPLDPL